MTLDEFMLLKEGDRFEGMDGSAAEVCSVLDDRAGRIVSVSWGGAKVMFDYSNRMTAWMHWSKIEPEGDKLAELAVDRMTQRREESVQSEDDANGERTG